MEYRTIVNLQQHLPAEIKQTFVLMNEQHCLNDDIRCTALQWRVDSSALGVLTVRNTGEC